MVANVSMFLSCDSTIVSAHLCEVKIMVTWKESNLLSYFLYVANYNALLLQK